MAEEEVASARATMRRDAKIRREALLAAATACFEKKGYNVALEEIARLAGVGRGTLYRNFKDRAALVLAIFNEELERVETLISAGNDLRTTLVAMTKTGRRVSMMAARVLPAMVADEERVGELKALQVKLERTIQPLVERSHRDGTLRQEVDSARLGIVIQMISRAGTSTIPDEADEQIGLAVSMLIDGIAPKA